METMNIVHNHTDTSGILLVDKPLRMTSHDVVNAVRRIFGFKKVGHAGTLDPMATGLLILLIGKATKKSRTFLNDDKSYETTIRLGVTTDTGDSVGNVLKQREFSATLEEITDVLNRFKGEIEQVPPMFSAKRHKGKKLYQYARKGVNIERCPRKITIKNIELIMSDLPYISINVTCSKGTYIRQLAVDIGEAIGCGAHVRVLRRTASGPFSVRDAVLFDDLKGFSKEKVNENIKSC